MGDFRAATWNAEGITPISGVLAGVKQLLEQGATVLLLQEVSAGKCATLRDKLGLKVVKHPKASNAVAWLPDHWDHDRTEHVTLADPYLDKTRNKTIHTASPLVHLRHRKTGREVGALSYHLPSRVQRKGPIDPERIRVRNQALATMDRLAGAMPGEPLFGGDDNVDERTGKWPTQKHLRQIAAPEGTLGGRKIDDFRVRDLVARGALVNTTKSQHDSYLRGFDFPAKVTPKPKPTPKPDTKPTDRMNPKSYFVGAKGDHVKWLAGRLVAHGYGRFYGNGVDRGFTRGEDLKAVAAFQRAQGWRGRDADGLPGNETLKRLAAAPKRRKPKPKPAAKVANIIKALVRPTRLPDNLPGLLRKQGLTVVEVPGWQARKRPGLFAPVGTLWHHTGSYDKLADAADDLAYAKWLAVKGRSDLPAPLCQLSISREGVVYICAAGRANHAGKAKAHGSVVGGDGNRLYVGIECMNDGTQGWDKAQRDAMVTVAYVLHALLGTSTRALSGHKETSVTGKWDPGHFDMDQFRADVAHRLNGK